MSRFQLSPNVEDVDAAVDFYANLFGVAPSKHRDGYANFALHDPPLKLVVVAGEGEPGSINHVGIEYESGEQVAAETERVAAAGLPVEIDQSHTCCFATQEKAWTKDADNVPWELYTVVADTPNFGASPRGGTPIDVALPPVTLAELRAGIDDPAVVVIDAQASGGYQSGHVPGAIDADPTDPLTLDPEEVIGDRDRRVIVYCSDEGCRGAESVGLRLVRDGYTNVGRFPGGWAEWQRASPNQPS